MDPQVLIASRGRKLKHPAMITYYKSPKYNLTQDEPLKFLGIDFETDVNTGKIMLMGVWTPDNNYFYAYKDDIFKELSFWILRAIKNEWKIVHWSKFDEDVIVKLFGENLTPQQQAVFMERAGKINGKWSYRDHDWEIPPLCQIFRKNYEFGIDSLIAKKNLSVYYLDDSHFLHKTDVYEISQLYQSNLESTCKKMGLDWYSKLGKEYHIVDWSRFDNDPYFHDNVLLSNQLDCRAAKELADLAIKCFYDVWKAYPERITSTGTIGKMAFTKEISKEDYESINIQKQMKNWGYGKDKTTNRLINELLVLACECYKGGMFETYAQGYSKECYIADISACYPAAMSTLLDLRGSKIEEGYGPPPTPEPHQMIFVRGTVDIPKGAIHTMAVHNPDKPAVTIRPWGQFETSYTWQEREFAKQQGAKFFNEYYIIVHTFGEKSPVAIGSDKLFAMRLDHMKKGLPTQYIIKIANNSQYGILIEGVERYKLNNNQEIEFDGYAAGVLFNPLLAAWITAHGRITLCTAMMHIKNNGGTLIQANTDSVHWAGSKDNLPEKFQTLFGECGWTKEKKRGFFEEPQLIKDFVSISTGRYGGFNVLKNEFFMKLRSYKIEIIKESNVLLEMLKKYKNDTLCQSIPIENNRLLISAKLASIRKNYSWSDIGLITDVLKEMKFSLDGKCDSPCEGYDNPIPMLLSGLNETSPYCAQYFRRTINEEMKNLRQIYLKVSDSIPTEKEKKDIRRQKDKSRKRLSREFMTEEQKMLTRFKDRERKRKSREVKKCQKDSPEKEKKTSAE